jgi:hypothetical protein
MACGEILIGSEADCENLPAAGTKAVAYVYNYNDWEEPTVVDGKITAINLVDGKFGNKFTGLANAFLKSEDFARSASTGVGRYKHKHTLVVYERTQEIKDMIRSLGNGRFIVVLLNRGTDADAIEAAGQDVGVELQAGEIRNAYANDGFFVLNMATPEGEIENETAPMQTVWITDYETTVAMLDATLATS